jgi:CheY-like chemotaxis protein
VEDVLELRSVIRQALQLRGKGALEVVAEAADGVGAVTAAFRHQPDIIVLDLGLPDLAGHEVLTQLRAVSPGAQVVVYTGSYRADQLPPGDPVAAYVSKAHDVGYLVDLLGNLDRRRYRTSAVRLGADRAEVATARRFLADRCREWSCGEVADDAALVASELVTNALVHSGTGCEFRLGLSDTILRIQVTDGGPGMPDPRTAALGDESGRGLLLVSILCAAWGTVPLADSGKVVWAELLRQPDEPGGDTDGETMARRTPVGAEGAAPGDPGPGLRERGPDALAAVG